MMIYDLFNSKVTKKHDTCTYICDCLSIIRFPEFVLCMFAILNFDYIFTGNLLYLNLARLISRSIIFACFLIMKLIKGIRDRLVPLKRYRDAFNQHIINLLIQFLLTAFHKFVSLHYCNLYTYFIIFIRSKYIMGTAGNVIYF